MFYARFISNNQDHSELYDSWPLYLSTTFNPSTERIVLIDFSCHGKTYADRKEHVRNIAIDWSNANIGSLSYGELHRITSWFRKYGARYGLLREFSENAVI